MVPAPAGRETREEVARGRKGRDYMPTNIEMTDFTVAH